MSETRDTLAPSTPIEIGYRLDRRVRGISPGMHPGTEYGGGLEPLFHGTLLDSRDPRRLDLLASMRDPLRLTDRFEIDWVNDWFCPSPYFDKGSRTLR